MQTTTLQKIGRVILIFLAVITATFIMLQILFQNDPAWNRFSGIGGYWSVVTDTKRIVAIPPQSNTLSMTNIQTNTVSVSSPTITDETSVTTQPEPAKTLWDWLQLLIVPAILAIGAFLLNQAQHSSEQQKTDDQLQEETLQDYLDKMSHFILGRRLVPPSEEAFELDVERYDAARDIARTRTLAALRRLNGKRNAMVLRFLRDTNLIGTSSETAHDIVDLQGQDLSGIDLSQNDLSGLVLEKVQFIGANLKGANLTGTNLKSATFGLANLEQTVLVSFCPKSGVSRLASAAL